MTIKNNIEIEMVSPSSHLGSVVIEGYVNDAPFSVNIVQSTHAIKFIEVNDEIVWTSNYEAVANPINAELLNDFRYMVATQIRTIKAVS